MLAPARMCPILREMGSRGTLGWRRRRGDMGQSPPPDGRIAAGRPVLTRVRDSAVAPAAKTRRGMCAVEKMELDAAQGKQHNRPEHSSSCSAPLQWLQLRPASARSRGETRVHKGTLSLTTDNRRRNTSDPDILSKAIATWWLSDGGGGGGGEQRESARAASPPTPPKAPEARQGPPAAAAAAAGAGTVDVYRPSVRAPQLAWRRRVGPRHAGLGPCFTH